MRAGPSWERITLENFRGVRTPFTYELGAPVVLVWGPNGTGKTTLIDAFLWLLQGGLPRLSARAARRGDEVIRNAYAAEREATVRATLRTVDGSFEVERRGSTDETVLRITQGDEEWAGADAERQLRRLLPSGDLSLSEMMRTSGVLQQDDLREVLHDRPDERYRQMLRLLGLERLEQFQQFVVGSLAEARASMRGLKDHVATLEHRLNTAREELETASLLQSQDDRGILDVDSLRSSIDSSRGILEIDTSDLSLEGLTQLLAELSSVQSGVTRALETLSSLPEELPRDSFPVTSEKELAQAEARVGRAERRLTLVDLARRQLEEDQDRLNSLVALVVPMLEEGAHGEHTSCPVCRTEVNTSEVVSELVSRSSSGTALVQAQRVVEDARAELASATDAVNSVRESVERSQRARRERIAGESTIRASLMALQQLTMGQRVRLVGLNLPVASDSVDSQFAALRQVEERLSGQLVEASARASSIAQAVSVASRRVAARAEALSHASNAPRIRARVESIEGELAAARIEYQRVRELERRASKLRDSVSQSTESILRERFDSVAPLMNDIYGRLDPHPTFSNLDFIVERHRARGTATARVVDEAEGISADPLIVFSAAQANIVVLSAFLALGWSSLNSSLPFVLLDDPLQSLDDVNVLGFADLLRQLRDDKQIIISTHDERFARLIERKLLIDQDSGGMIIHRFLSWSRNGPMVETRRLSGRLDRMSA